MSIEYSKQSETSPISGKQAPTKVSTKKLSLLPMLQMQQSLGNQTMLQLLRSLQTKLTVGEAGDQYEQEADRVAEQVMRMPDPDIQRQAPEEEEEKLQTSPLAGTITPLVQRQQPEEEEEPLQAKFLANNQSMIQKQSPEEEEEPVQAKFISNGTALLQKQSPEEEEEKSLQAKAASNAGTVSDPDLESSIRNLRGGGSPLPEAVRNYFEPRFGYDFSQVRVHNDSSAAYTAQVLNAKAFTLGHDVVFGSGQYAPEHEEGKKLLAHELTHVVQQNGG